ncbi:interferon alpha/beta receptor 2-like [Genypterus blacodes]|uniref:interferon alpha/beta receptor 2-like n=1 Tax=Genypterus blacodes TaxID=154954 RepID=UPI003F76160D
MELWMLLLLQSHIAVCVSLPAPVNVSVTSINMEHTLSFLPGPGTPADSRFTVQVVRLSRRNNWKPVPGCLELTAGQTCNLTSAFKDALDRYRARVQAFTSTQASNWTVSRQFQPLMDTVLGPPDVLVSGCGNCLLLRFRVPSTSSIHQQQLQDIYRGLVLLVRRTRDGAQFTLKLPYTEERVVTYLQPGVEYCVTVRVTDFLNSNSVPSKPHCAFTSPPQANTSVPVILGLLCAFCLLGFLLIGSVVYGSQLTFRLQRLCLPRTA